MSEMIKILPKLPMFAHLSDDQLDWLAKRAEFLRIGEGNLFYDNTAVPENYFYILLEGEWLVTRQVLGSNEILSQQGGTPGAWHGGFELIEAIAPAKAKAVTDCNICRVHQEVMLRLIAEVPGLAKHLLAGYVVGMIKVLDLMD
jgi:CRP-like cAMP-binding protein